MKRILALVLFTTGLLAGFCSPTAYGEGADLPAPPTGFQWYEAKNHVGTFLVPHGWFVKEESREGTNALFISREDIDSAGRFVVGLTVNEISHISRRGGAKASEFARSYADQLRQKSQVLKSGVVEGNASDMHVTRVKSDNNGVATVVHHISIGNDALDSAYIIIFEAPASEWEAEMEKGGPMLNFFFLGE